MATRTVLITGASSGIGEALAQEWAEQFQNDLIILAARKTDALEQIKKQILARLPAKIEVQKLDLEQPKSIVDFVQVLTAENHIPDLVIHNAGLSQRSLAKETSIDVDRRLMEVNYFGTVYLTKLLLPHFLKRKQGQIAVVTSLVGKFGSSMRSGYAGSKHALHGFFDSLRAELAAELGPDAVPITMICPGFIRTNISVSALTKDGSTQNTMDSGTGGGMEPRECARRMIAAIQARKYEATVGGKETLGVLLKRFLPGLFTRMIYKAKVT
ncbi:MAG: SDR family oxidoreductase [Bdellovibrionales bacterium]|nr:SDR family oxidoreductase [Bdellovibrionales bacterium]